MTNSSEEQKPKKSNKSFFSKLWKSQSKDDKKKTSKSVDNLSSIKKDDNFEKEIKALSENPNNSLKSKSLDILNSNTEVEEINLLNNRVNSPYEIEKGSSSEGKIIDIDNDNSPDNNSYHTSFESTEEIKKTDTIKSDYKDVLNITSFDKIDEQKETTNKSNFEKHSSLRKSSSLTLLINNKNMIFEKDGLTAVEFAEKLYNLEESEYEGKPIALILTETDPYHEETLKYYMKNFDFSNVEIDEALRILCKKLVITGETQQIDRILTQFSKQYFESNTHRQDIFLNEDVTHSIVYSLVLLNTDLHIVYNDNPNKKMTKKEFLKNTMTLLESMTDEPFSSQKIKSANIPNYNRRSYFGSPNTASPHAYASVTLPRNFTESYENKQKKWKKQMEQLLGELYNSIKTKKILQKTAPRDNEINSSMDGPASSNSINSIDSANPSKTQSLFGNDKSNTSSFSSVKNLIGKSSSRKAKDKNTYLSMPSLSADSASYSSTGDLSYSNRSYDRLSTINNKSYGLGNKGNAVIVHKGALIRKHYLEQGKQRAKDRRWVKAHCAIFVDQSGAASGICELRIWLENSSKKKNAYNKEMDEMFEIAANEPDIETQNIPYYNSNYQEALPLTHSITNIIKTYTSINALRKNVFSLKLSSGITYLFEAASEDIMKDWVNVLNFWAARKSKEPLRGAVGNMEYGWSQVEKIEKPKPITEEDIHEPIPYYDAFDSSFDTESIKSFSSNNQNQNSRPNSIRSGLSVNKSDPLNMNNKDLNISSLQDNNSIKDERPARSFTIGRFRSARSTSRSADIRSSARSMSLNREEGISGSNSISSSTIRSYSCTRRPSKDQSSDNDHNLSSLIPSTNSSPVKDHETNFDLISPLNSANETKSVGDIQISPLSKEPMVIKDDSIKDFDQEESNKVDNKDTTLIENNENKDMDMNKDKDKDELNSNKNLTSNESISQQSINSIKKEKSEDSSQEKIKNNTEIEVDDSKLKPIENTNNINITTNIKEEIIKEDQNLLHRRILSEPQLRKKREMDKNSPKKRSQSLNNYSTSQSDITQSESNINDIKVTTIAPLNMINKSKADDEAIPEEEHASPYVLPKIRSHKPRVASKHQSLMPDKFVSPQRFSLIATGPINIQPGGTLTIKKKIKKLRISDWTQPGVGYLLSTLSLEKQYESMKRQYLITERELEEHKEIKQPMEDLYVFQSTAYQKACNNWKKKYLYLLDEKNKYGLYVNILENHMKEDPNEEHIYPSSERKVSTYASSQASSTNSLDIPTTKKSSVSSSTELSPLPEKKEKASQDEIKSILAKKRQQQLDLMKKTANDLLIDSGKLENKLESNFVLPEIKLGNSILDDDEYEKEMEELALEQERILNMNKE